MSCPLRYATKRQLEPNISSYPVAREVIAQAVENTWQRALRVSRGEMTLEALEKANLDLVIWLQETFTGANPHFSCESEFNGRRLAELMRDNMRSEIEASNPAVDFGDDESVFCLFCLRDICCLKRRASGNSRFEGQSSSGRFY